MTAIDELERVLSLSLNMWIQKKSVDLKSTLGFCLKEICNSQEKINNINKFFDATIEDWYFITGSVGLRLSYKNTNVPNQTKIRKLKDILSLTFLDAKSKQFF